MRHSDKKSLRQKATFRKTLIALLAAIVLGLLLRFFGSDGLNGAIDRNLLTPLKSMFLNALKLVVTPVVFFMISSSVAGISDLKAYGRIGAKVLGLYLFTSVMAILVGVGISALLDPSAGVTMDFSAAAYEATVTEVSLVDTVVGIVPSNILAPFVNADMIQIIFLAVLLGVGVGLLEQESDRVRLREGLNLMNRLFLKISTLVLRLIPLGTFCAVALLILEIDGAMIAGLLKLIGSVLAGAAVMMGFYALLFFLMTRKNPFRMMKKCIPNYMSFALLCSTSAVMPQTLDTCTNRLGIDPEVSSFSMPLGSTMNMDGACIYLTVSALFLAGIYGIDVTPAMLVKLGVTTLLLSVGAPPIPGAGFICLSILVMQLGIPMESIGFLLGIDQIMSMCRTVVNGAGDITVTAVVACNEGRMDMRIFDQ